MKTRSTYTRPPANRPNAVAAFNAYTAAAAAAAAPESSSIGPSVSINKLSELGEGGGGGVSLGSRIEPTIATDTEDIELLPNRPPLALLIDNLEGPFANHINGIYRNTSSKIQNNMPVYKKGNSTLSYLVNRKDITKGMWVFTVNNKKIGYIKSAAVYPQLIDYSKDVWNFSDVDENKKLIEGTPNVPHPEISITKYDPPGDPQGDYGFYDEDFYGGKYKKTKKSRRKSIRRYTKNKRNTRKRLTRRR